MAEVLILIESRKGIQKSDVIKAIVNKGVDGEIAYPERGEILKEVGPLARIDPVVFQPRFQ